MVWGAGKIQWRKHRTNAPAGQENREDEHYFSLALWADPAIMPSMVIDFHTHVYPDHMAEKTLTAVRERAGIPVYQDGTLRTLKKSMKRKGIDCSVVSSVATRPDQVQTIHEWLLSIRQPGILTMATMHPDLLPDREKIHILKTQGFKGFKAHPDSQDFFVDERRMYPFYEAVQEEGMLVLFHAGVDRSLPNPVHAMPEALARVHRDFPRLTMVAAHMGGEGVYEETERHLLGRDIYMDTSFVIRKMPLSLVKRFMERHPVERLLFGSDTPWGDQERDFDYVQSLPFLTDGAREKILGGNAFRLLGLEEEYPARYP